jgi:hypothetical protein
MNNLVKTVGDLCLRSSLCVDAELIFHFYICYCCMYDKFCFWNSTFSASV